MNKQASSFTVLFDLDGTLTDSEMSVNKAFNSAARLNGYTLDADVLSAKFGPLMTNILVENVGLPLEVAQAIRRDYSEIYSRDYMDTTKEMPYASMLLSRLHSRGLSLGLVTNKSESAARKVVYLLGWTCYLRVLVGNDTAGRYKPWPEPVLYAMKLLDVEPAKVVFVGDREVDMESARAAHVPEIIGLVGTREESHLRSAGANKICNDLREVESVLNLLISGP